MESKHIMMTVFIAMVGLALVLDKPKQQSLLKEGIEVHTENKNGLNIKIITIDSCEYIFIENDKFNKAGLSHKGNCKNHKE